MNLSQEQATATGKPVRILYVDDSAADRELVRRALQSAEVQFDVEETPDQPGFEKLLADGSYDLVLSDLVIGGYHGFEVLRHVREHRPNLPVIIVTGSGSEEVAVEALKGGAADYVLKKRKHLLKLPLIINTVLDQARSKQEREQALAVERNLLQTLVKTIPDAVYIQDLEGRILVSNFAESLPLGITSDEEAVGKQMFDLFPEEMARLYHADDQAVIRTGKPIFDRHRSFTIGGRAGWFSTTKVPWRDTGGKVAGVVGITRDVTAQREAEQELVRLAKAVEQSGESLLNLSPEGVIQYVNPAFERISGCTRDEVVGQSFDSLLSRKDVPFSFAEIAQHINQFDSWTASYAARRKDGSSYHEEASISAVRNTDGQIINYLVIHRDVTREATLEEQVRQSQKMEAIGMLAGGVAHDFNNILQVVQGFAALALEGLAEDDERAGYLAQVINASARATQLTRQLLAFGRRQRLERVDTDLNDLVSELLKLTRRLIGEDIKIDFIPGYDLANVKVDRGQMEQVLMNLCVNARDAMPNGGCLTIAVRNVVVDPLSENGPSYVRPGSYVVLSVTDTGVGIDPGTMQHIFEPFFTTKPKEKGTGLGLPVVYGIIKQHDGHVQVQSEPGRGSVFQVYLPAMSRSSGPASAVPVVQPKRGSETILLAEDEPGVRALAEKILERGGYRVITACNGREACDLFARLGREVDLLVFDVIMPEMSGREAYEQIVLRRPGMPVLFCSGYSGAALQAGQVLGTGMQMLSKPYLPAELLARVRNVLDSLKHGRPA